MHVLYVHRNFPAQFGHIAGRLIEDRGWQCTFVSERPEGNPGGVRMLQYKVDERNKDASHPLVQVFDDYGRHCLAVVNTLKAHPEVRPDLIVGHCGFGSTALLRELYDCPIINFFEYYYHRHDSDIDFRADFPATDFGNLRCRVRNAGVLLDLQNCDAGYSPTEWQRSRFPAEYQNKIATIFDGIDTDFWFRRPLAPGKPRWVWGRKLGPSAGSGDPRRTKRRAGSGLRRVQPSGDPRTTRIGDRRTTDGAGSGDPRTTQGSGDPRTTTKVVTYVSRGFESIRGFDIFMKVARRLCELRSDVIFVCVGTDEIHYGPDKRFTLGKSFREHVLAQDSYDLSRFIFTGRVSREELARIFSVSDLHIYLTVPFVLSWSCMNALACGCTVLGSAMPPVQEVIQHEENGLLAEFYDVDRFVELANKVLDDPQAFRPLGEAAVRMIEEKYSLDVCLPKMIDLYERTVARYKKCGFPKCSPHAPRAEPIAETQHTESADYTDGRDSRLAAIAPALVSSNGDASSAKFTFTLAEAAPKSAKPYQTVSQLSYGPPASPNGRQSQSQKTKRAARQAAPTGGAARGRASPAGRCQAEPGNESNGEKVRVLLAIPHAFGRDSTKPFHSFRGAASERIAAMTACLKLLHQTFGGTQQEMALIRHAFTPTNTALAHEIDVVVCTSGQRHLLAELDLPAGYFRHEPRQCEPIMLGFECHALLRDNLGRYDFYCYLEDDLLIRDPWFFAKQRFFNLRAGNECLLQPNRYEVEHVGHVGWAESARPTRQLTRHLQAIDHGEPDPGYLLATASPDRLGTETEPSATRPTLPLTSAALVSATPHGPQGARKTYIDGDLDERLVRKYQNLNDQPEMAVISMGVPIPCRRTLNPHCGGFFLNAEQMEHWSRQRHFLDQDCSFFSPIESANTFGVMRTFKIYKPAPAVANFLEIEHFGTSMTERLRQRGGAKNKRKAPAAAV